MSTFVHVQVDGNVGVIRLDRPPVNAINSVVHGELLAAADEVAGRTDIRAVVLYGGERSFAAGADIKEMAHLGPSEIAVFGKTLTMAIDAVARLPQPVVAAVTGYALGGGCRARVGRGFPDHRRGRPHRPPGDHSRGHPRRRRNATPAPARRGDQGQGTDLHRTGNQRDRGGRRGVGHQGRPP